MNDYKFNQVWRMSATKCAELVREIRHAEETLHAYVLAEPPPPQTKQMPRTPLKTQNGRFLLNILIFYMNLSFLYMFIIYCRCKRK